MYASVGTEESSGGSQERPSNTEGVVVGVEEGVRVGKGVREGAGVGVEEGVEEGARVGVREGVEEEVGVVIRVGEGVVDVPVGS